LHGLAIDKTPDIVGKAAELLLYIKECPGVFAGTENLEAIAYDPRVKEDLLQLLVAVTGDLVDIEIVEQVTIALSLAQYGNPGKARLSSLQDEELEKGLVVPDRYTPLLIVVLNVQRIVPTPAAARYHPNSP
jgi:hypothetical protein